MRNQFAHPILIILNRSHNPKIRVEGSIGQVQTQRSNDRFNDLSDLLFTEQAVERTSETSGPKSPRRMTELSTIHLFLFTIGAQRGKAPLSWGGGKIPFGRRASRGKKNHCS